MSAAHTPGPWSVAYLDQNGQAVVKAEHIEIATCWHHCVGSIEKEMHHNARLIAAAPDLLEALQEVTDRLAWLNSDDDGHIMALTDHARTVIAKATRSAT